MKKGSALSLDERKALDAFVKRLYTRYTGRVTSVALFGSKARGDAGSDSDLDVVVVLADDDPLLRWEVRIVAARVSLEYDLLLSVRAVGRSQWEKLAHYRFPIYQAIQAEGIDLTPQPA